MEAIATHPGVPSPIVSADARSALEDLLESIEAMPEGATGALSFQTQSESVGSVMVESGRICWAAVSGYGRRLTDLLAAESTPRLDFTAIQRVFNECRLSGLPLGQTLVARGIVSAERLRCTLLQHTAESLDALVGTGLRPAWVPRTHRGYNPQFTFSTGEVLASYGALAVGQGCQVARDALSEFCREDAYGIVFVRALGSAQPIPIQILDPDPLSASTLVALGKWTLGMLDVCAAFSDSLNTLVTLQHGQRNFIAWRQSEDLFYVAFPHGAAAAHRIIGRRLRLTEELRSSR